MKTRLRFALPFVFAAASTAGAQGIVGRDVGLSGAFASYNFDGLGLASGVAVTNQLLASGLLFEGAYYGPVTPLYGPSFLSPALYNYDDSQNASYQIVVSFSQAVSAVAFNFATTPGTSSFKAYKGNTIVASTVTTAPEFSDDDRKLWWGFEFFDGTEFDRLEISNQQLGTEPFAFGFDNLQVGAARVVPEPSSIALLAVGLCGLGFAARRRRR